MSLNQEGYVAQPYVAWVDFWIATGASQSQAESLDSLTQINGKPARLLSFEHTIKAVSQSGGGASEWKLELFDTEWTAIENKLFQAVSRDKEGNEDKWVEFQYYYTGGAGAAPESRIGLKSYRYKGRVVSCVPTFTVNGVSLSIEGFETWMATSTKKRTESYEKAGLKEGMRIDEIVKKIISVHKFENWMEGKIEETDEVYDTSSFYYSSEKAVCFNNPRMDHHQFIKKVLIPRAVSAHTGRAGYVWYLEHTKEGAILCHFHPENMTPGEAHTSEGTDNPRTFTYIRGDKNTEVLSFSPEIIGEAMASMKGSTEVAMIVQEPITKRSKVVKINDEESSDDKVLYNAKSHKHKDTEEGQTAKILYQPVRNIKEAEKLTQGWYYSEWVRNYQATLEIVGDPRIKPLQMVRVFLVLPDGKPHYTSGGYIITEVTHRISPGSWVTSMNLARGTSAEGYKATGTPVNWG